MDLYRIFLLFVTGENSVKDIYVKLPLSIRKFEKTIAEAENFAQRSELWIGNRNDNQDSKKCLRQRSHKIYRELHNTHQEVIDALVADSMVWSEVKDSLSHMVDPFFEDFGNRITLAYPCDHFTKCYGFNRFLTLLIVAYIREKGIWGNVLVPQTAVTDVFSTSHDCQTNIINQPEDSEEIYRQKVVVASNCFDENTRLNAEECHVKGLNQMKRTYLMICLVL